MKSAHLAENENSMHENENFMHENKKFAPENLSLTIPCMKLCTAQLPMKMYGTRKSCQGRNSIFLHVNIIFRHEK